MKGRLHPLILAAIALAPAADAAPLEAQQQRAAAIPADLAAALLTNTIPFLEGRPTLSVGRAPDTIPAELLAIPDARILGGAEYVNASVAVLAISRPRAEIVAAYDTLLAAHQWTRLKPPELNTGAIAAVPANPRAGAAAGRAMSMMGPQLDITPYCKNGTMLWVTALDDRIVSMLKLVAVNGELASACSPSSRSAPLLPALRLPVLRPPPGGHAVGSHWGGGTDDRSGSVRVQSDLASLPLAAHYLAELRAAGWVVDEPREVGDIVIAKTSAHDENGQSWNGFVAVQHEGTNSGVLVWQMSRGTTQ